MSDLQKRENIPQGKQSFFNQTWRKERQKDILLKKNFKNENLIFCCNKKKKNNEEKKKKNLFIKKKKKKKGTCFEIEGFFKKKRLKALFIKHLH